MNGLKNVRNRRVDALSRVGWDRLEILMADYYQRQGYQVEHVGTGGAGNRFDGGVDLKLHKDGQYIVVQCKHWNAKQVPHNAVHELLGIMVNEGANGAILATSGEFTPYARESASKSGHVQLIDGDALRAMLGPLPDLTELPAGHRATAIANAVGERLVRAAEDRIRGNAGRRRPPASVKAMGFVLLAKMALAGLALLLLFVAFRNLTTTLTQIPARQQAEAQARLKDSRAAAGAGKASAPAPSATRRSAGPVVGRSDPDPCHELIDWRTGTYIDHCTTAASTRAPTAAEIRESRRKADEAAAILAPNTPEM